MVGTVFANRFHIERLVGTGAMAKIYRARQTDMDRPVAVKVIHPDLWGDAEVNARFERELKVTTRIEHPNTVRVYEHGRTPEGQPYLVMEFLDGHLLSDVIAEDSPLSAVRIAHIGMQLAQALAAAHAAEVVHRDLKPENIILLDHYGQEDFVKVLDFGLSRVRARSQREAQHLTLEGVRVGTPLYMAPEYVAAYSFDHRSDLYALGVILFEMATGKPPYKGKPYEILEQQVHGDVPRPSTLVPNIPAWLDELIMRLLAKDPEERIQSGSDVARVFERAWANLVSQPGLNVSELLDSVTPAPAPALLTPEPERTFPLRLACLGAVVAGALIAVLAGVGVLGIALVAL
jgi:serine/threonine-protein kinase